ncbi:bifunctional adenosylcobinamide kinase/adenosylcobinamide-phosphate guanylyltransferase [Sphaerimonospora thailandensis]|uniref:Adenosylcobinamide kinase n=1 Tax=Sphaerimonospora thailandensis TaxID=795644 RepID=A0A8J3RAH0_9ACTN|nr:bifunctional adenosylcobinamide kinase/adenosylcobinamide-phosphate guanylyltransferase [Sphaerimonospora thailandensis]GIH70935.1 adenosylcobinamide kinase/adenosylcobinamide phosphate guanyltransferase [Sphaerimonospora thailandensis]
MEVRLAGTGGPEGWPAPGCGCASCGRLAPDAPDRRAPASIVIDGLVRLPSRTGTAQGGVVPDGYLLARGPDGYEITGPDRSRMLYAPSDAGIPDAPRRGDGLDEPCPREPFDLLLIDLLDEPERLGDLRRRGRVTPETQIIAVHLDHRVPSETELARRLAHWRARAVPDGTVLHTQDRRVSTLTGAPASGMARRTLLLGGARSGKSEEAELRVAADPDVTYVATGPSPGDDPSWLARVKLHRDRRPRHWRTLETTDLTSVLATTDDPGRTLLIDGIGTWLAAMFDECGAWPGSDHDPGLARAEVTRRCDELVAAWRRTRARVVAVSDEVGLGVVPATAAGGLFRDELGRLNQRLARESEDVAIVIAGRLLPLPI